MTMLRFETSSEKRVIPMGIHRSHLRRRVRQDAAATKIVNRVYKTKERARRDARMVLRLKGASLPYSPEVMSWLSRTLDKKARQITPEDVKTLLA